MIIYKVSVTDELKEEIEQIIKEKLHELKAFQPFAILVEEKVIIGYGVEGDDVVIDQIVDMVLRADMAAEMQGKQFRLNRSCQSKKRPIIQLKTEEAFGTILERNRKLMNMLRHGQ